MSTDELTLLKQWQARRDAEAFNTLVSSYSGLVYATCRRILRNAADAEEVTQECFLRLAQECGHMHTSLPGWLHRLATTRSLDRIRTDARRQARERIYGDRVEQTIDGTWDDVQEFVDQAIEALPESEREVVVGHFLLRRTQVDLAHQLKVNRRTIANRISRGITAIRADLEKRGIPIGGAALAVLLASHAAEAAPAAVAGALGKLALAGAERITTGANSVTSVGSIGGVLMKKTLGVFVVIVAAIVTGGVLLYRPDNPEPVPAPAAPLPLERTVAERQPAAPHVAEVNPSTPGPVDEGSARFEPQAALGYIADQTQFASVSGRVTDVEGTPIIGVVVSILAPGKSQVRGQGNPVAYFERILGDSDHLVFTETGSDGRYTVAPIRFEGRALVSVNAPGYVPIDAPFTDVQLLAGDHKMDVDFVLEEGMLIEGRVLSSATAPIADAVVFCEKSGGIYHSNASGVFSLSLQPHLDESSFMVYHARFGVTMFEDVPVLPGDPIELLMAEVAALHGRVTHRDGTPAAGYIVRAESDPRNQVGSTEGVTDADGRYAIERMQATEYDGYVMRADRARVSAVTHLGTLRGAQSRTWDIELDAPMRVSGVVRGDKRGRPMANKYVVWTMDGRPQGQSQSDAAGKYELLMYPGPGRHQVIPMTTEPPTWRDIAGEWRARARNISVVPGRDIEIDLTLPDTFSAAVQFVNPSGEPIAHDLRVQAYMHDRKGAVSHREYLSPDADGRYSWDGFEPGLRCFFDARPDKGSPYIYASTEFKGESGGDSIEIVVPLFEGVSVVGRLLGPGGIPLVDEEFSVSLTLASGEPYVGPSGTTQRDGRFRIERHRSMFPSEIPATELKMHVYCWPEPERLALSWESDWIHPQSGEVFDLGDVRVGEPEKRD